jgi:hypothetical protein
VAAEVKAEPAPIAPVAPAAAPLVAQAELPPTVSAAAPLGSVVEANRIAQFTTPAATPVAVHASVPARMTVAEAFATPSLAKPAVAAAAPVPEKVRPLLTAAPRFTSTAAIPGAVSTTVRPLARGSHYIQLGAFSSYRNAKHAWGYYSHRNPALAAYRLSISEANVKGKHVWRVAVGGISGRLAASTLCGRVKASGGACFAYSRPLRSLPAVGAAPVLQARAQVPAQPGAAAGPVRARR